jgi:acyl dehydratase
MTATIDVQPGFEIPELVRTIELPDMIAYAGSTWDWHRLHYDHDFVARAGLPGPVVDGQVFGALLAEMLMDWLGPRGWVSTLSFRFKNMVFAGETVRCTGVVTAVEGETIFCDHVVYSGSRVAVAPASSRVVLRGPSNHG